MNRDSKRPRLGRGLSSLIRSSASEQPGEYEPADPPPAAEAPPQPITVPSSRVNAIVAPIVSIDRNPYQPRRAFDQEPLNELADSIRAHGVLQPVLVAELPAGEDGARRYRLIAGERRLRAAELAGVSELPCIVRAEHGAGLLEVALIENMHRSDLNAVERANAFRAMMDQFSLTQEDVSGRLGLPRPTVANYLRILDLCDDVQKFIIAGSLSFGHAKVLAGLAGDAARQTRLARAVVAKGLSVRQLEDLVKAETERGPAKEGQTHIEKSRYLSDVERQLSERVGTKVMIRPGRGKHSGRIVIEYYSLEDFDRVIEALGGAIES